MKTKTLGIGLMATLLSLGACQNKPNAVVEIKGILPTEFTKEVKYAYLLSDDNQHIDSAEIKNGSFVFEIDSIDSLRLVSIDVPQSYRLPVIIEQGTITADYNTGLVYGTPLNDDYKKIVAERIADGKIFQQKVDSLSKLNTAEADIEISKLTYAIQKQDKEEVAKYLNQHPNDEVGILILRELLAYEGIQREEVMAWREVAGEKVLQDPYIKERYLRYDNEMNTQEGAMFTDFEGLTSDGKATRLSDYVGKGKYVLLDFWASWCVPCRYQLPKLKEIYKAYQSKGLEIVGVAVSDEMKDHQRAVEDEKLVWAQIVSKKEANNLYGIRTIPQLILLSPEGKILSRGLNAEELAKKLPELIK